MSKVSIPLQEALLRRKELAEKVKITSQIKSGQVFENKVQRIKVSDGLDEVTAQVAKLTLAQVTHEHDFYSRALRKCDSAIQRANWETQIELDAEVMGDYTPPEGWNK